MVSVCLTCGSEGFPEWLVYCNQCQVYALHRYCLDGPVIFDNDVTWFCEDCGPEVAKLTSLENSTPLPCGTGHNLNSANDTTQTTLEHRNHIKKVKKESKKLQNIMKKQKQTLEFKNHIKKVKKNNKKLWNIMKKQKETKDTSGSVDQPKLPLSNCSTSHCDQNHIQRVKKNSHKQQKKHKEIVDISGCVSMRHTPSSDCHASDRDQIQCSEPCDQTQCSDNVDDTADSNKVSDPLKNSGVAMNGNLNILALDFWADAQPVAQPIWRGSFFICNRSVGDTIRGLVAHASSLACPKVFDETKLFPEVLCADILHRSAVWPKGFKDLGPTNQSIALYIFPETERDEKAFDKVVNEVIFLDLAIRAEVERAEFLVFPSTVLPTQYWRFNRKYYLWGVFRAKHASNKH